MSSGFLDSNVLLYLLSADPARADRAQDLLRAGVTISVQVLNEVTNVARRKLGMDWREIEEFLSLVRHFCTIAPVTEGTHDEARRLAERYQLSFYDALICAAALQTECSTLFSEDMQDGLLIDERLRVRNPFVPER